MSNPAADFYFEKNDKWLEELKFLRKIVLDCGLNETVKWGCPCYVIKNANVLILHVFKEYCAILFFKGVLLKVEKILLFQQTTNVQATRQLRFKNLA